MIQSDGPRSVVEGTWVPAGVETARIVNVNIEAWSVDIVSEYANKRYFDLQVMSPYFHFVNGEGIYCMPEVGAMVWVCRPSMGRFGAPFVMGYQAPFEEDNANFRCGRQNLNPGDIMMRTRDENFIVLRRGGVIQIGATPVCQTMYVPIHNMLRHFCENYEVNCFGGEMTWFTERSDQTTDGSALTKFSLKAKEKANDPQHVATLTVGSHGEDDKAIVELVVYDSGLDGQKEQVRLTIDKDGNVDLYLEKDLDITAKGNVRFESSGGNFEIEAVEGKLSVSSAQDMGLATKANFKAEATGNMDLKAKGVATLEGSQVLCGAGASNPAVKFNDFAKLIAAMSGFFTGIAVGPLSPVGGFGATVSSLIPLCQSSKVKLAE